MTQTFGMRKRVRVVSYRRAGRLLPKRADGLRAGAVTLKPGGVMDWHSNGAREELLIALAGRIRIELRSSSRKSRRLALAAGHCALLPSRTLHRVLNRSRRLATYLYVTASSR